MLLLGIQLSSAWGEAILNINRKWADRNLELTIVQTVSIATGKKKLHTHIMWIHCYLKYGSKDNRKTFPWNTRNKLSRPERVLKSWNGLLGIQLQEMRSVKGIPYSRAIPRANSTIKKVCFFISHFVKTLLTRDMWPHLLCWSVNLFHYGVLIWKVR